MPDINTMPTGELIKEIRAKINSMELIPGMVMGVLCNRMEKLHQRNQDLQLEVRRLEHVIKTLEKE